MGVGVGVWVGERPSDVTRKFPSDLTRYLFLSCDANASCLLRYDARISGPSEHIEQVSMMFFLVPF